MMQLQTIKRHPQFPHLVWVVVEQPAGEPNRLDYDPLSNIFHRSASRSLFFDRGWPGAYGWLGGLGTPPAHHCDVILITHQTLPPGAVIEAHICGIFYRSDGDHKVVALDHQLRSTVAQPDLAALDSLTVAALRALYPRVGSNEGWWGAIEACTFLQRWGEVDGPHEHGVPIWGPNLPLDQ